MQISRRQHHPTILSSAAASLNPISAHINLAILVTRWNDTNIPSWWHTHTLLVTHTPYWWHTHLIGDTHTPYWWHTHTPYWWHIHTPYWWQTHTHTHTHLYTTRFLCDYYTHPRGDTHEPNIIWWWFRPTYTHFKALSLVQINWVF